MFPRYLYLGNYYDIVYLYPAHVQITDSEQGGHPASIALGSVEDLRATTPAPEQINSCVPELPEEGPSIEIPSTSGPNDHTVDLDLDTDILEILGDDPTSSKDYGNEIQKDLAIRLEHSATMGLPIDTKKDLKNKYLVPSNCKLIDAPQLNPEIKAAVSEVVLKRDKAIAHKQKQMATAISSLGEAISSLITSKDKNSTLLRLLMDASRLLCDCQNSDSLTRRNYILCALKKDMKEQLRTTKIDEYLFGNQLAETLKAAKAINKSGAELKSTPMLKPPVKKPLPTPLRTLNWKGPPARRQPGPQRTKEPAPPPRQRQQNASKQSYNQQSSSRGRR